MIDVIDTSQSLMSKLVIVISNAVCGFTKQVSISLKFSEKKVDIKQKSLSKSSLTESESLP